VEIYFRRFMRLPDAQTRNSVFRKFEKVLEMLFPDLTKDYNKWFEHVYLRKTPDAVELAARQLGMTVIRHEKRVARVITGPLCELPVSSSSGRVSGSALV
jgi:hypothetical protein